jgi:hypothetical protein
MYALKVYELNIKLSTIIPGQSEVKFTRQMLSTSEGSSNTSGLTNVPFFSFQARYPTEKMGVSYEAAMKFFFNRDVFENMLTSEVEIDNVPPDPKTNIDEYKKYCDTKNDIVNHNIMTMLYSLFPVRYPVINDIKDSYNLFRGVDSMKTLWFDPLKRAPFSYLNIGSKKYTVQKVIWMNDMANHPRYREFLSKKDREYPRIESSSGHLNIVTKPSTERRKDIKECYDTNCKDADEILYVGIDMAGSNYAEMYLMVDLIDGEVNTTNMRSIYCPLFGEITGDKLEQMYRELTSKIPHNTHRVDEHRYMFSLKDKTAITSNVKEEDAKKTDNSNEMKENQEYNEMNSDIRGTFERVFNELKSDKKFEDMINEAKLNQQRLLLFIKRRYRDILSALKYFGTSSQLKRVEIDSFIRQLDRDIVYASEKVRRSTSDKEEEANRINMNYSKLTKMLLERLYDGVTTGGSRTKSHRQRRSRKYKKKLRRRTHRK